MAANVLSAFETSKDWIRGDIVRHAGRIRETQTLKKPVQLAFEKKVVQALESFDVEAITPHWGAKAGFDKTISHVLLGEILATVRAQHMGSINDFDCVMILYDNLPVYCFLNTSKLKMDSARKKLALQRERLAKDVEVRKEGGGSASDPFVPYFLEETLRDMDGMLSGQQEEDLQRYCALQMDEYSFCLDLNHHAHTNLTLMSSTNILLCGCCCCCWGLLLLSVKKEMNLFYYHLVFPLESCGFHLERKMTLLKRKEKWDGFFNHDVIFVRFDDFLLPNLFYNPKRDVNLS